MLFLMCEYPFFRGQDWSIVKSLQRKPSAMAIACSIGVSHPILTSCLWKLVFIKTAKKSKESRRNISGWYQIIPCARINIHDVSAKKKTNFYYLHLFFMKNRKIKLTCMTTYFELPGSSCLSAIYNVKMAYKWFN